MAPSSLTAESFGEYGVGIFVLSFRLFVRLYLGGLRGLCLDDAFVVAAMVFWTMQTVIIYLLELYGTNIGLDAQTAMLVPESQMHDMILGSQLAFMNWIWYICFIWCLKGVMLCLYWRLTDRIGIWRRRLVKLASTLCVVTWLACLLTHVLICAPVHRNWQIKPYPGAHCTLRQPLYVVTAVTNILTDVILVAIPIPMLLPLQINFKSKAILIVMFSSAVFIMICTVLRAYYSLGDITNLPTALRWAGRECCAAAIIASLPGIRPIFRNMRWLSSMTQGDSATPASSQFGSGASGKTRLSPHSSGTELESMPWYTGKTHHFSRDDSQEQILGHEHGGTAAAEPTTRACGPGNIHVTTEVAFDFQTVTKDHRPCPDMWK
ncbi:hypothetical protein N7523_005731 [Penicillium sp. IBT 18751x]|nr:hypothetical protein N7523_005675 [Penicillium sp. IBT 18751x]KAJ6117980.1 hypothetical protein N7523_005731 [Penicillium sp. IBT 18751x]